MGYLYTIIVTVMFSFVATLGTLAKQWVSAEIVAFSRFFFGSVFIIFYMLIARKKFRLRFNSYWIWFGVVFKCLNYLAENAALSEGYTFGQIIGWPVQAVVILFFSIFMFHEKITARAVVGAVLCAAGVFVISWNGRSLSALFADGRTMFFNLLFIVAGICAACFTVAQRKLIDKMDSCNLNLSMFLASSAILGASLPLTAEFTGDFVWTALLGLVALGVVTGIGFILAAEAMKTVPLFLVTIIQSMNVFLTIVWSVLFFNDPVTRWVILGTAVFVVGMVLVNLKGKRPAPPSPAEQ